MFMTVPENSLLEADFELGFTYTRSPGIIIGKFLAALKQKKIFGIRANDGSVLFPPTEYDTRSAESLNDFVPLVIMADCCIGPGSTILVTII